MNSTANDLIASATRARHENRPVDARRDLVEAVAVCRTSSEPRDMVRALKALGQIERDAGHADAALPLYEEAVAVCRQEGEPLDIAHTVRHLGDIHHDAGRMEAAEACFHEALAFYRGHDHTGQLDLANAIRSLAVLKDSIGASAEATLLWQEAKNLYEAVAVPAGVAECAKRLDRAERTS